MTDLPDPPSYYPVSLDVSGRSCLVVGGGGVAARKARALLDCGGAVTVIAPDTRAPTWRPWSRPCTQSSGAPTPWARRRPSAWSSPRPGFRKSTVRSTRTPRPLGSGPTAPTIVAHSSFILPAVHRDGAVTVAVSTGGLSPALASWLRTRLAADCGDGIAVLAHLLAEARARLKEAGRSSESVDWRQLLDGPLLDMVRAGDIEGARATVRAATEV